MENTIQILAVICFYTIGFSHIFHSKIWAKFFIYLKEKKEIGSFINGFLHFPFGVIIVTFHNVWSGIPIILTLIGYGLLLTDVTHTKVLARFIMLHERSEN